MAYAQCDRRASGRTCSRRLSDCSELDVQSYRNARRTPDPLSGCCHCIADLILAAADEHGICETTGPYAWPFRRSVQTMRGRGLATPSMSFRLKITGRRLHRYCAPGANPVAPPESGRLQTVWTGGFLPVRAPTTRPVQSRKQVWPLGTSQFGFALFESVAGLPRFMCASGAMAGLARAGDHNFPAQATLQASDRACRSSSSGHRPSGCNDKS